MDFKKIVLPAFVFVFISSIHAQSHRFTISGRIEGLGSSKMFIIIPDDEAPNGYRRDSIMVENDVFQFTSNIDKLNYVNISPGVEKVVKRVGNGYYPVKSSLLQLFVFPGADVKVSGSISDLVDAYPTGDPANNDLARLNRAINPLTNAAVNMNVKIANKIVTDTVLIKKMKDSVEAIDRSVVRIKKDFIRDNLSSVASAWLLSDMMIRSQISNEDAIDVFRKMNQKLADITYYKEVDVRVKGILTTRKGDMAPAIESVNTPDGKPFSLASLKGKYVVLDFWGTWCVPCIQGMPRMKEYLDKYKGKLEIVGVAKESDKGERWKKFLNDKPAFAWHHVLNTTKNDHVLKYNVAGYPTKIIVDPSGVILDRYVGEDDGFYKRLDQLLQ
jgi:thiol-disulfide isomerase/thioredoxin